VSGQANDGQSLSHRVFHINTILVWDPIAGGHRPLNRRNPPSDKSTQRLDIRQYTVIV
jgi:hypothetical protein